MSTEQVLLYISAASAIAATMSALVAIFNAVSQTQVLAHQRRVLAQGQHAQSAASFRFVIELMEQVRKDRNALRAFTRRKKSHPETALTDPEREAADRICRQYEILGLLDRRELIDRRVVNDFYAGALIELYESALKEHMALLDRGPGHFWELKQLYERVKKDRSTTIEESGKADWLKEQLLAHGHSANPATPKPA